MIRTCDPNVPAFISHLVPIPECCPVSKNPKAGSTIRVSYRPRDIVVPVEALEEKVRGYIGGFETIRGMEEMIQDLARWSCEATGVRVRVVAELLIAPPYGGDQQTMRVSARSTPTPRDHVADDEEFNRLLRVYVASCIEQDDWDRVAPVGMTKKQAVKERRLHSATESAYDALVTYVTCVIPTGAKPKVRFGDV